MQKYCDNKSGSLFFVLIIVSMIMSLVLYGLFRSTAYLIILAQEREVSEKHYYMAHSLQMHSKIMYNERYKDNGSANKIVLFKGSWPYKMSDYSGYAWIEKQKDLKRLYVEIKNKNKVVVVLSSVL